MTEHVVFAAKVGGTNPAEPITRRLRPFSDFRYYRRGDATALQNLSSVNEDSLFGAPYGKKALRPNSFFS